MVAILFYLGAAVLVGLGALLTKRTTVHGRVDIAHYERIEKRRSIGQTLMGAALVLAGTGYIIQFYSGSGDSEASVTSRIAGPPLTELSLAELQAGVPSPELPEGGAAVSDLPPPALAIPGSQPADLSITDVPVGPGGEVNSQGELVRDDAAVANSVSIATVFTKPATDQTPPLLREAFELMAKKISGGALEKVNEMIVSDSKNAEAYALRGSIYAQEKDWGHALQDYQTALQFNAKDVWTRTNVADIEFGLKTYDAARANFAEVTNDEDMGDYAKYMVFLCDLLGGHEDVAQKELDAFNQVGSNASYYFANAGWSLFHQKKDEANDWLASASRIYPPFKLNLYGGGLTSLRAKPEARGEFSPVPAGPVAPGR